LGENSTECSKYEQMGDPLFDSGQQMRVILVNPTFQIGHHGCTLVDRQLDRLAAAAGIRITAKLPLYANWSKLAPPDFDAVVVNGEGSLYDGRKSAQQIAAVPAWARARGRPAFLINSVYESNGPEIAAGVSRYKAIYVREPLSQAELAGAGIPSTVVPDLTLTWVPTLCGGSGGSAVVTDSASIPTSQRLRRLARGTGARFLPLRARPPRPFLDPHADIGRWQRYAFSRLGGTFAPPGLWRDRFRLLIPEFDDFVSWLATNAGLIVAGRFHAVCLAFDLEIPVLAVPTITRKIEGLLQGAGLQSRLVGDLDELERRLGREGITPFLYSASEIERIRTFRKEAAASARAMFETIRQTASTTIAATA
jgi:hypothetical protein